MVYSHLHSIDSHIQTLVQPSPLGHVSTSKKSSIHLMKKATQWFIQIPIQSLYHHQKKGRAGSVGPWVAAMCGGDATNANPNPNHVGIIFTQTKTNSYTHHPNTMHRFPNHPQLPNQLCSAPIPNTTDTPPSRPPPLQSPCPPYHPQQPIPSQSPNS